MQKKKQAKQVQSMQGYRGGGGWEQRKKGEKNSREKT